MTEQWAQVAVAGPRSRELMNRVLAEPIDNAGFPFMACGEVRVGGVAGRLFRISFSGEQAYEVAVPARYGAALWRLLVERAAALGGGAYGLEALNVLRIEKGLLTHAELTAARRRTTSGSGGCWRPARTASARPAPRGRGWRGRGASSSSGCRPVAPDGRLLAGAHVVEAGRGVHRGERPRAISPPPAIRRPSATTSRSASS